MLEPRVVYACNHNIVESFDELHTQIASMEPPVPEMFSPQDYGGSSRLAEEAYKNAHKEWKRSHFGTDAEFEEWQSSCIGRNILFEPKDLVKSGSIHVNSVKVQAIMPASEYQRLVGAVIYPDTPCWYEEGVDYRITSEWRSTGQYIYIDWLKGGKHPQPIKDPDAPDGSDRMVAGQYRATMRYTRSLNETYRHAEECPRCCGDGWYVGLFEIANTNPGAVRDANKLVQAFFKFIHTKKLSSGYGSVMTSLPGKYDSSDTQALYAEIEEEISKFEQYYKNHISTLMLNGSVVTQEEQLRAQSIMDMELDEDSRSVSVRVRFFTMSNEKLDVSLVLPEEDL